MKIVINTEGKWIKVDDETSFNYNPQSPVGTAVRLLLQLLRLHTRRQHDLTERTR